MSVVHLYTEAPVRLCYSCIPVNYDDAGKLQLKSVVFFIMHKMNKS